MRSVLEIQLDLLLTRNAHGRLVATRDPVARPAPRLFLARAADGNVWATRCDVDDATSLELEHLCSAEPWLTTPSRTRGPVCRDRVLELLEPIELEFRGPSFVLPDGLPADERAREVRAGEKSAWPEAFPWLADEFEHIAPVAIAFEDGQPAAICHSPRGVTAFAAEAGVETLAPFRRRGLAAAAVASWARAVQRTGRLALYTTTWDNAASLAVARRLAGRLHGEIWHVA